MSPVTRLLLCFCTWLAGLVAVGCSDDMDRQPSFQPMEAPRLHSPPGSIPRDSRVMASRPFPSSSAMTEKGRQLYATNCAHCHGQTGTGDGPVAGYLRHLPTNLQSPHVQAKPEAALYTIVTEGLAVMPSFTGELSAEERWAVARYVKTFDPTVSSTEASDRNR
jgi:cytochrome c553